MNEDGSIGIPHGTPQEEEAPVTPAVTSGDIENTQDVATEATPTESPDAGEKVAPITPATLSNDEEPVDIFASPEERAAEAEAATQNAESAAIAGSRTSGSHMANNPFHNRNRYQASTSTGQTPNSNVPQFFNDAIIANTPVEPPKQSKKGLFVGLGIGAVALIGVALIAVSLLNKGGTTIPGQVVDANGNKVNTTAKSDFYRYANTLLYGNDSTDKLTGSYDANTEYDYQNNLSGMDRYNEQYVVKISGLYSTFYTNFSNANNELKNGQAYNSVNDYNNLLNFIKLNPANVEYTIDNISSLYAAKGESAARSKINSILETFKNENNDYSNDFYLIKEAELNSFMELFKKADAKGCIQNSNVNSACIEKNNFTNSEKESLVNIVLAKTNEATDYIASSYNRLGFDCWQIANSLENNEQGAQK